MRTKLPRTEPRTAPTTTPVLEEPDEDAGGRVTCAVWVGVETSAVVRKVVDAALYNVRVSCSVHLGSSSLRKDLLGCNGS